MLSFLRVCPTRGLRSYKFQISQKMNRRKTLRLLLMPSNSTTKQLKRRKMTSSWISTSRPVVSIYFEVLSGGLLDIKLGWKVTLMPGSDGRQESLLRRDVHSFSPLVVTTRGENEWTSRRNKLSCLPSEPGLRLKGEKEQEEQYTVVMST